MQPTLPQAAGTADMDLTAVQSMDWFFKKEQIYLLAQFWQQRATLAEKEVNTLKEQLSTNITTTVDRHTDIDNQANDIVARTTTTAIANRNNSNLNTIGTVAIVDGEKESLTSTATTTLIPPSALLSPSIINNNIHLNNYNSNNNKDDGNNNKSGNNKLLNSVATAISLQNGGHILATTPSPSPPLSDNEAISTSLLTSGNSGPLNGCLNPKVFFNHAQQVMMMEAAVAAATATSAQQQQLPPHSPQPATQNSNNETLSCTVNANNNSTNSSNINNTNDTNIDSKETSDTITFRSSMTSDITHLMADSEECNSKSEDSSRNNENQLINTTTSETAAVAATATAATVPITIDLNENCTKHNSNNSNKTTNTNTINSSLLCKRQTSIDMHREEEKSGYGGEVESEDNNGTNNINTTKPNGNEKNDSSDDLVELAKTDCVNKHETTVSISTYKNIDQQQLEQTQDFLLAAKDKEIRDLVEEVNRLKTLEHKHLMKIRHLEENIDVKEKRIIRLETYLNEHQIDTKSTATSNLIQKDNNNVAVDDVHIIGEDDDDDDDDIDNDNNSIKITDIDSQQHLSQPDKPQDDAKNNLNDMEIEEITYDDDDKKEQKEQQRQYLIKKQEDEKDENHQQLQRQQQSEDDECIKLTEHMNEINIKKETQSPPLNTLDCITQQSAIAAAAAAAVACNNDPNKFQELLIERTKALVAAEVIKNSDTEISTIPSNSNDRNEVLNELEENINQCPTENDHDVVNVINENVAQHINSDCNKIPKIELDIDDDDDDDDDGDENDNHNNNDDDNGNNSPRNLLTTEVSTEKSSSTATNNADVTSATFRRNVEHFGSLLGEELVNTYWRRSFDMSLHSNNSNIVTNANHLHHDQQHQQQMLLQHAVHHNQQPHMTHHHHHHHHHRLEHEQTPSQSSVECQQQQQAQQSHAPSSTALLSQLVNSTFATQQQSNSTHINSSTLRSTDVLQNMPTGGMHHQQHLHHHHHHHSQSVPLQHQHQNQHHHHLSSSNLESSMEHNKSGRSLHDSSGSSTSTPNLHDQRSNDENILSLNCSHKPLEDNNNRFCATPTNSMASAHSHMTHNFLPGLPFQFQDRGHFHFAEDMQLPPGTSMAGHLGESLIPKSDPMEAKLQEMLRYNMDKYANQALDTLHISRRVRELLSVHNIGQRIFAKYVLGLSQGTVSELLSKPKPWDKLTEKGRDSYRKMHAWSCDENAVMLLKSLIPKKDSGLPPYGGRDDIISDERIAHLLNETSSLMKTSASALQHQFKDAEQQRRNLEDSHVNEDSKSPLQHSTSPCFKDQLKPIPDSILQNSNSTHLRPDETSPEKMARLYHEIMSRVPRDAFPSFVLNPFFNSTLPTVTGVGVASSGNAFASHSGEDNMRVAFEREMVKMQQQHHHQQHHQQQSGFSNFSNLIALQQQVLTGAQDLSVSKEISNNKDLKTTASRNSLDSSSNVNSMDSTNSIGPNTCNPKENTTTTVSGSTDRLYTVMSKSDGGGDDNHTPISQPSQSSSTANTHNSNSTAPSPLSNTILPPVMVANDEFSATASPLQRMASITNSLITQPPIPPHHPQPQRPTKAVLPPITQQQFDMFNNLNTEDIVRRVKEALSQYSISQRLFGESVLGLSQGSVSDLLARPKPWHMLTQKGREPFIRMKMFLEDENAVHKLVASQYKIAPEKLMRTGNYSGAPQLPQSLTSKMQGALPMQKMINDLKLQEPTQAQHIMQQMQAAAVMSAAMQQQQQQQHQQQQQSQQNHHQTAAAVQAVQAAAAQAAQHHQSMLLTSPGLPPQHTIPLPAAANTNSNPPNPITPTGPNANDKKSMMMPIHSPHTSNAMRSIHQHMSPTVYEMAALTQDLDTQVITTKIKEALLTNNIGQKIFGEAVLGLSQGSVSELLSKPKPWHMLSIKGREPFIRMQLWLSDANNVERLQVLKNERREASKRRRSTGPNQQDNSSDTSSNDTNDFYTSSPGPGSMNSSVSGAPPSKKQRVLFSEEQKEALRLAFALDPYPNLQTIEFLANELGLATRTITNWFHNHRMRLKQQVPHGPPGAENPIPSRENTSATPFDPVQFRILLQQRLLELHKERMGLTGNNPLPYPPYFAAAALLGRSLAGMPGATSSGPIAATESDLQALNQAFKEQISGLDLSMSSLKRERRDDFDDDIEDSRLSENENDSLDDEEKISDYKDMPQSNLAENEHCFLTGSSGSISMRSSRRKPAAPQWVNPAGAPLIVHPHQSDQDCLINGVCKTQSNNSGGDDDDTNNPANDIKLIPSNEENRSTSLNQVGIPDNPNTDLDTQRFIEPEVVIKQEKLDSEVDSDERILTLPTALATPANVNVPKTTTTIVNTDNEAEDNITSIMRSTDEHLRMVRVHRLSAEDEHTMSAASSWRY